ANLRSAWAKDEIQHHLHQSQRCAHGSEEKDKDVACQQTVDHPENIGRRACKTHAKGDRRARPSLQHGLDGLKWGDIQQHTAHCHHVTRDKANLVGRLSSGARHS
ncbi:hypothetical protein F442_15303, partial [Phytophthora nicotianae P10297]